VLADGAVGEVRVERSAGHPALDAAAIEAIRRWRFEPARRGAEPVEVWILLPVRFTLG
jgi:protein TonB